MQFNSIQPLDRALSGATIPGQSGPGSNSNEGMLCIPLSPRITGTSPSECFVSYPGHSLWGFTPLQMCSRYILQSWPTGQASFCHFSIVFSLYIALQKQSMPSNFLVFSTSGGILSRPADFLPLILLRRSLVGYL